MIFPYRDENCCTRPPIQTLGLIAFCEAIFLCFGFRSDYSAIVRTYGLIPAQGEPVMYLTSIFLHGGLFHLAGNMWYLWLFGDNIEDRWGRWFIPFYVAAGVCGNLFHVVALRTQDWIVPLVGASGAVSGLLGAYLVLYPRARISCWLFTSLPPKTISINANAFLVIWFVLQLAFGLLSLRGGSQVAYGAHIGGFIFGVLAATAVRQPAGAGPALAPRTSGPPGELPETRPPLKAPEACRDIIRHLERGEGFLAMKAYVKTRRQYPYDVLDPDRQLAMAKLFEENRQPHLALEAYHTFLKRYDRDREAAAVKVRLARLYDDVLREPERALRYLGSARRTGEHLPLGMRQEILQRQESLEAHLSGGWDGLQGRPGERYVVVQETTGPMSWDAINALSRLRRTTPLEISAEWRRRPGWLLAGVEADAAGRAAGMLQAAGLPVLVLAESELQACPPPVDLTSGSWSEPGGLTVTTPDGSHTIAWDDLLLLSCTQIRDALPSHRPPSADVEARLPSRPGFVQQLDIFAAGAQGPGPRHFRLSAHGLSLDGASFRVRAGGAPLPPGALRLLVEDVVRQAPWVPINDGIHALLFDESWEPATFDTPAEVDRYHEWQMQLATVRRRWITSPDTWRRGTPGSPGVPRQPHSI